ncbi:22163_t:CDS:2 [Entrophospora sp. SA101]|nr:22163_t:CDS:2 [Entrophospora sp. SA101]CAJ0857126.1 134_t:CDS:2 [Entrophospora sp. SA101]CAJ0862252.1 3267_t:CDS:2 [Entrophospora sp. SA101]CAJ0909194.1 8631_t:CDS:2 [Entrophospora sp. SA101]
MITKKTNENGHEKNEEQEQDDEELITPTRTNLKTILEEKAFNKNNNEKITLEGRDDSSSGGSNLITDNILKRRPSAPSKLNVDTIKIDQTNYNKTKTNNNIATKTISTSTPTSPVLSLVSPKIMKLRRKWNPKTNGLKPASPLNSLPRNELDKDLLARLEQQNSQLPPQGSAEFLLARLEKQNELLDKDPKSVIDDASQLKLLLEELANNDDFIMTEEDKSKINDWDFWSALIQDYPSVATKLPHLLAAKLQNGCPPKLRSLIWQSMSQASSTYLETMYEQLLPESSPYERIIQRDLARTFPHVEMFKEENGKGQTMLWNVLKAYSLYDPLVGYCQGLGFLVGPLLMNMNETQAFCVFVRLMETYDMRTMFTLNMEGLQLRLYQFSSLLTQILPKLHAHFQLHAVQPAMFASQWFLSLFAYTYPLPLIMRIYDVVFAEGAPETIMRVAIALLKKNEERLLSFGEFEDLLDFLTSRLYESYDNEPTGLIKDAMELSTAITKAKLDQLDECYVKELEEQKKRAEKLVAVRFNGRFTIGNNKQSTKHEKKKDNIKITNNATNEVKKHEKSKRWSFTNLPTSRISFNNNNSSGSDSVSSISSITSDISISSTDNTSFSPITTNNSSVLHQQIEDLVTALSVLQKEHVDITAQLVSIKMEKMDLVTDNENLKNRLRGLEKENKRISSTFSISSVSSLSSLDNNKRNSLPKLSPRRTSSEDPDITPRPSTELTISHKGITKVETDAAAKQKGKKVSERRSSESDVVKNPQRIPLIPSFASMPNEITDELVQTKMEKFDLMQENDELNRRIEELQSSLEISDEAQTKLKEKNSFLREEIERLKKRKVSKDAKELKTVKKQNQIIIETTTTTTDDDEASSNSQGYQMVSITCNGKDCEASKQLKGLEQDLIDVKLKLAESEGSKDILASQLDSLRSLVNTLTDNESNDDNNNSRFITRHKFNSCNSRAKPDKRTRTSSISIASFFGGGGS